MGALKTAGSGQRTTAPNRQTQGATLKTDNIAGEGPHNVLEKNMGPSSASHSPSTAVVHYGRHKGGGYRYIG